MSIKDGPHYVISTNDLATWIERQGGEQSWMSDDSQILLKRIALPALGEDLAKYLRYLNRPVLIKDPRPVPVGNGETIGPDELDSLVVTYAPDFVTPPGDERPLWADNRMFNLAWIDSENEFVLEEDRETSDMDRRMSEASVDAGV